MQQPKLFSYLLERILLVLRIEEAHWKVVPSQQEALAKPRYLPRIYELLDVPRNGVINHRGLPSKR